MKRLAVVFAVIAVTAAQSLNYTTCASLASSISSCISSAANTFPNSTNAVGQCCTLVPNFVSTCGGMETILTNRMFLTDYISQQNLVNNIMNCQIVSKSSCQYAASQYLTCAMNQAFTLVNATFVVSNVIGGSYTLLVMPPYALPGSAPHAIPLESGANQSVIASRILAANPQFALTVQAVTRTPTASGFTLYIQMLANMTAPVTALPVQMDDSMLLYLSGVTGLVSSTFLTMANPVDPATLSSNSLCCQYVPSFRTQCSGYDLKNASSPNYMFPFPLDMDTSPLGVFVKTYHNKCPQSPQSFCTQSFATTHQCLVDNGYYASNGATYRPDTCCEWARFANKTCMNHPSQFSTIPVDHVPLLMRQFSDCRGGDNNNNNNNNQGMCSSSLPNLFVWMNGTQPVPVISYCNPTNPYDPNYRYGCNMVTSIGTKAYYVYYPLLNAPGTWHYNPSCTGY